ncbi:hypothetical protein ACJIZ3_012722 [Penstemon smallii]|uniref:Late embryogenesis abundant protein LEA-2 subgroup domain-containing protein n=1 Tax=Penstemon smallii TaxID=265156 RepID=A0ABD3URD4_9LAMI
MGRRRRFDEDLGIYCWFFCVVTILSLLGVVAWLSLIPRNPRFRISNVNFPSLNPGNISTTRNVSVQNNSLLFGLEIYNPNERMGIYYNSISLHLYRAGGVIGTNSTPGFYQGYKDTTLVKLLIRNNQEFWQERRGGGVEFTVRVETEVRFRIIKWKTKMRRIEYEASFSNVKFGLNGTVSGGNYTELHNASKAESKH